MKTFFYKKGIILLATLFVAGITLSCHDADDEQEEQEEFKKEIGSQNQKKSAYQVGDFVEHIDDITAIVSFNQNLNEWYLRFIIPQAIDAVYHCYPSKLDEKFLQEGTKVVFSGDVYETSIRSAIAKVESYRVIITSIHEWTVDDLHGKVGYWYNDQFLELICCDPNTYFVQARATENPISQKRVEEILTSLGAEITVSGSNYCFVNAEQRPVHPDLYVSPTYKPKDSPWREYGELWIGPRIYVCLNEGASWDEILSKYGTHLRLREGESIVENPNYLTHNFDCDLPTAEEILRLSTTIHLDHDVKWCEAAKTAKIILDYGTKTNVLQIDSEGY